MSTSQVNLSQLYAESRKRDAVISIRHACNSLPDGRTDYNYHHSRLVFELQERHIQAIEGYCFGRERNRPRLRYFSVPEQLERIYDSIYTYGPLSTISQSFPTAFLASVLEMDEYPPESVLTQQIDGHHEELSDKHPYIRNFIMIFYEDYRQLYSGRASTSSRLIAQNLLDAYPWARMRLRVGNSKNRTAGSDIVLERAYKILDADPATEGYDVGYVHSKPSEQEESSEPEESLQRTCRHTLTLRLQMLPPLNDTSDGPTFDYYGSAIDTTDEIRACGWRECRSKISKKFDNKVLLFKKDLLESRRNYYAQKESTISRDDYLLVDKFTFDPGYEGNFCFDARKQAIMNVINAFPWSRGRAKVADNQYGDHPPNNLPRVNPIATSRHDSYMHPHHYWISKLWYILQLDDMTAKIAITWTNPFAYVYADRDAHASQVIPYPVHHGPNAPWRGHSKGYVTVRHDMEDQPYYTAQMRRDDKERERQRRNHGAR